MMNLLISFFTAEVNAKQSEDRAKQSELSAKASELSASASAQTATTKASEASTSEANAKASEDRAKQSETNAKSSEDKAKQSETNAKASEDKAKESETNSESSETNAKASELSASASAQVATTKANEASTSEANAKQSETLAKQYADEAKESANGIGNPVSSITVQDATLTISKADGEAEKITVDNVEHAKIAETLAGFTELLEMLNPIGKIWTSTDPTNPHDILGFGTWEAIQAGRVLIAQGTSSWGTTYNAGSTGGEATHTLIINEIPSHGHTGNTNTVGNHQHEVPKVQGGGPSVVLSPSTVVTPANAVSSGLYTWGAGSHAHNLNINATGGNQPHNNMQPYLAVYMWQRTA